MLSTVKKIKKVNNGSIVSPKNFQAGGLFSGVKRKRNDLGMIYSTIPAHVAAVYTTNVIQAAPIKVTKDSINKEGKIQAVIVNSGNANACTGIQGEKDAYKMRNKVAKCFSLPAHYVAVASTGIIGENVPMDKVMPAIDHLKLDSSNHHAEQFNESILTTDTITKSTCYETVINGKKVLLAGSAKGSGMIEPNMATMLSFITTDAAIESNMLQVALKEATNKTFNCITVDGDTSTNDMVLAMANGAAENETLTPQHKDWHLFIHLLTVACEDLAKMIAKDGEGATRLIEVEVSGAANDQEAVKVAKSVVGSSLVKTAIHGRDANWGRIIAAVGYSRATVNPNTIDISIGSINLLNNSEAVLFSEEEVSNYLKNEEIKIAINLNIADSIGKAWGCDLTYDYVRINTTYRS